MGRPLADSGRLCNFSQASEGRVTGLRGRLGQTKFRFVVAGDLLLGGVNRSSDPSLFFNPLSGESEMKKILAIALVAFAVSATVGCSSSSSPAPAKTSGK